LRNDMSRRAVRLSFGSLLLTLALSARPALAAAGWAQSDLLAPDAAEHASLGWAVATDADGATAAAGAWARRSPSGVEAAGAIYVFSRSGGGGGYVLQQEIFAAEGSSGNNAYFGWSVALSRDGLTLVGGAPGDALGTGAVLVFERASLAANFSRTARFAAVAGSQSQLGTAVALSGNGVSFAATSYEPAVLVFQRAPAGGWALLQRLVAGTLDDLFGSALAFSDDASALLVGAMGKYAEAGAAYLFERPAASWAPFPDEPLCELTRTDGGAAAGEQLGGALALSATGLDAVLGAAQAQPDEVGVALHFARPARGALFAQRQVLAAPQFFANFGADLTLSADGQVLAVGAPGFDVGHNVMVGAVFVFRRLGAGAPGARRWLPTMPGYLAAGDDALPPRNTTLAAARAACEADARCEAICFEAPSPSPASNVTVYFKAEQSVGVSPGWWSFVLERANATQFAEEAALFARGGLFSDGLGAAVAVSGDGETVVAGSPARVNGTGAAYAFSRDG
jgi:hypothetical protein